MADVASPTICSVLSNDFGRYIRFAARGQTKGPFGQLSIDGTKVKRERLNAPATAGGWFSGYSSSVSGTALQSLAY